MRKIYDSELKILQLLWNEGNMPARDLANRLKKSTNWKKTTTYTIINRCINKGLIERLGNDFICHAVLTKEEAQKQEFKILVTRMFDGSSNSLATSLSSKSKMTTSQIEKLCHMISEFIEDD